MTQLLASFWRAVAYLFMPRIIGLSLLPVVVAVVLALGLGYFFWVPAVDWVRAGLDGWWVSTMALDWLEGVLGGHARQVLAPLVVVVLAVPLVVVASLLLVAAFMTPAVVDIVADRRFAQLERKHGSGWFGTLVLSVGATLLALLLLLVSIPLWFIPPLVLIIPPLVWGWLTARVMGHEVLASHASTAERKALLTEHRWPLLVIGVITGYLGVAPTAVWAFGALSLVFAPLFVAVSVWLYTLVFAFAALWFAHYELAALEALRRLEPPPVEPEVSPMSPASPPSFAPPASPTSPGVPPMPPGL